MDDKQRSSKNQEMWASLSREESFSRLLNGIRDCAIYIIDLRGYVVSWNAGAERIKGYSAGEVIGRHFSEFYTPEDRAAGLPALALDTAAKTGKFEGEGWRLRKDGTRFWAAVLLDAIHEGDDLIGFAKITRDMTERRSMQQQLNQSQKMEAIGQLTGGIAHDFNNLLTVILGNLDKLSRELPAEHARWHRAIDQALYASEQAASLTQQLLAFARRQPLKPQPVDVNRLLARWTELIRRTLPESIAIRCMDDPDAGHAHIDRNQLENALLNLAVNARDAMPNGGTLTLEAASVTVQADDAGLLQLTPGNYVVICVSDTGVGMSKEVLDRAFEPFFTTKPLGKGTGLGLSQILGFVQQSGGTLQLHSRQGHGTTIRIYLPRVNEAAVVPEETQPDISAARRAENVLVVEDNDAVREFSVQTLHEHGFQVLEAVDAAQALRILESHTPIHLLFADIGLPGLNGEELAATVQRKYPNVRILFTSGHMKPQSSTVSPRISDTPLLPKPFTSAQLYKRVCQVLDSA
jgi:PAS domain S-box-containing protein